MYSERIEELKEQIEVMEKQLKEAQINLDKATKEYDILNLKYEDKYMKDDLELERLIEDKKYLKNQALYEANTSVGKIILNIFIGLAYMFTIISFNKMAITKDILLFLANASCIVISGVTLSKAGSDIKRFSKRYREIKEKYNEDLGKITKKVNSSERKLDTEELEKARIKKEHEYNNYMNLLEEQISCYSRISDNFKAMFKNVEKLEQKDRDYVDNNCKQQDISKTRVRSK